MKWLILLAGAGLAGTAAAQNVYFGNLHAHTSYSDGRGLPDDAYRMAREAGLDFYAVTEHNHAAGDGKADARDGILIATNPSLYSGTPVSLREAADQNNVDGSFVAIFGQEFSTISSGNHVNVFDAPSVLRAPNGQFNRLVDEITPMRDSTGASPLVQFNHPRIQRSHDEDYGRTDFDDERDWIATMDPLVELIEVLNGPALSDGHGHRSDRNETEYFHYLNLGFHLAPSAGHDNHYRTWGFSTDARVAVLAPELNRNAVLTALRQRHAYATEDRNLRVIFRANGALGGDILAPPAPGSDLQLTVQITDDDEAASRYRVDVYQDQPGGSPASAPVESFEILGNTPAPVPLDGIPFDGPGAFVLLRVTQFRSDEHDKDDRVWTAPVWFETAAASTVVPAAIRIVGLIPNPAGDERLNEQVTLENSSSAPVSLAGWRLRDLAGKIWALDSGGSLAAGQRVTILRNGQPLALNNGSETVELLDPAGVPVQTVEYSGASEGQVITPQ